MQLVNPDTIVSDAKALDDRIPYLLMQWKFGCLGGYSILMDSPQAVWRIHKPGAAAHHLPYKTKEDALQAASSLYLYSEAS